jgi:methylamine dehydrogenase light chain
VGTCLNPADQKLYLISYHDCCGVSNCDRCFCHKTEGEMPTYRPGLNSEIIWCFGARNMVYNCTGAVVIGQPG